jgi:hypothetical protein
MYTENALLFPRPAIVTLRGLRGPEFDSLIEHILTLPETHEEVLAFLLMMINLNACISCETDSYRAMRGCAACGQQTLRRYKGTDDELLTLYTKALEDVRAFCASGKPITQLIVTGEPLPAPSNIIPVDSLLR